MYICGTMERWGSVPYLILKQHRVGGYVANLKFISIHLIPGILYVSIDWSVFIRDTFVKLPLILSICGTVVPPPFLCFNSFVTDCGNPKVFNSWSQTVPRVAFDRSRVIFIKDLDFRYAGDSATTQSDQKPELELFIYRCQLIEQRPNDDKSI